MFYVGVTTKLKQRIYAHREKKLEGFSKQYNLDKVVYYEGPMNIYSAICREKKVKKWRRNWKIDLIEKMNPSWNDLYNEINL